LLHLVLLQVHDTTKDHLIAIGAFGQCFISVMLQVVLISEEDAGL
jgi:hypothetical protein